MMTADKGLASAFARCRETYKNESEIQELLNELERSAAALNAQAGVVEALRPLAEAVERLDNARHGNDFVGTICAQSEVNEAARAALAAIKGPLPEPPEVKP
jgi:hypothetical protein